MSGLDLSMITELSQLMEWTAFDIKALMQEAFRYTIIAIVGVYILKQIAKIFTRGSKLRYWKINKRIELLEQNNLLLQRILTQLEDRNQAVSSAQLPTPSPSQSEQSTVPGS